MNRFTLPDGTKMRTTSHFRYQLVMQVIDETWHIWGRTDSLAKARQRVGSDDLIVDLTTGEVVR